MLTNRLYLICLFYFILDKNCILSFWNFHPLLYLWLFKCSKKNLRQLTSKQVMKTKIFVFQPIFDCYTILDSLKKFLFKKLIDKFFHRLIDFLWIFRRFSWFLLGKVVNPNLKSQFFYCSILIAQTMFCKSFKLDFSVDKPQLIPKVDLC
jgi:hypothetical protein